MRTKKSLFIRTLTAGLFFAYLSFTPVISQENKIGGQLELGYGFGLDGDYNSAQIFLTPLYKQNEQLSFGVGVGLKYYYEPTPIHNLTKEAQRLTNVPVYAAVNYTIPIGKTVHPFLSLKTGYGISSQKLKFNDNILRPIQGQVDLHTTGGFFISPAIGVAYPINNRTAIQLSLTYDLQKLNGNLSNDRGEKYHARYNYENISLRVCFSF